jgi:hypothetical protein
MSDAEATPLLAAVERREPAALRELVALRPAITDEKRRIRVGRQLHRLAGAFAVPDSVVDVQRVFSHADPEMGGWSGEFDRDGTRLVQCTRSTCRIWDLDALGLVKPWVRATQSGRSDWVGFGCAGRLLHGRVGDQATVFDPKRGMVSLVVPRSHTNVAFHPDRLEAVSMYRRRIDWLEGEPPMRVRASLEADGLDELGALQFAGDGALLVACAHRHRSADLTFLDPDTGVVLATRTGTRSARADGVTWALSLDARYVLAAEGDGWAAASNATVVETGRGRPYYRNPTMRVSCVGTLGLASLQTRDDEAPSQFLCDRALRPLHELGRDFGHVGAMTRDGGLLAVNAGDDGSGMELWMVSCRWSTFEDLIDDAEAVLAGEARDRWPTPLDGNRLDHVLDLWRDVRTTAQRELAPAQAARLAAIRAGVVRAIAAVDRSYARGWIPDLADPVRRASLVDPSLGRG